MNENDRNSAEWNNPDNWAGPRWLSLYFSKQDTRSLVPKQIPWMGWTLNLGHPRGVYALVGILVSIAVCSILPAILVTMFR